MTAIAWTLVGLMAGSLGVLSAALYSGLGRIDALGARLDGRIDGLGGRIDSLGARIDAQGEHLGSRVDALGHELRSDIREMRDQIHALDVRLTRTGS